MGYKLLVYKRYYYTFDNSLLFTESIQNTTQIFPLNHNVRFLPCQHRGVGIMQYVYAKPCGHRFNYSRTLLRSSPSGLWTWINQDTMTRFIAPDIH